MDEDPGADLGAWLSEPLPPGVVESVNRIRSADGVRRVCLMPDVHLASEVCVGAVVATEGVVYPQAVGGDIGCGMAALRFNIEADAIDGERVAGAILSELYDRVPNNKHRRAKYFPATLRPDALSVRKLAKVASRDGAVQIGTLGRGNHFLEFQADQANRLWVMLHSGSRAMGQAIAAHHLSQGVRNGSGLVQLDAASAQGQAYLQDSQWARVYAAENRLVMLRAVDELVGRVLGGAAEWETLIHSDHNHVRYEAHEGSTVLVHRKGAQSAREGEPGVVPGSMGAPSYHTLGRGCEAALASCSHGAGRRLSRTEARRSIGPREFRRQVGALWFDHRRSDRLRDESPGAYKDIREVMRAQKRLVKVERELRPILSYKGV